MQRVLGWGKAGGWKRAGLWVGGVLFVRVSAWLGRTVPRQRRIAGAHRGRYGREPLCVGPLQPCRAERVGL